MEMFNKKELEKRIGPLKKNDKLLVPAFICDVVIEELNELNIKPIYYLINKNFEANWFDIKKKYTKNC